MARQKRKEPREQPCLQPTELWTSERPVPGSWKRMLDGAPYIRRTRVEMDGKWVERGVHSWERHHELKAFWASQEMSMWLGLECRWAEMAAATSSQPEAVPTPNWSGRGVRK